MLFVRVELNWVLNPQIFSQPAEIIQMVLQLKQLNRLNSLNKPQEAALCSDFRASEGFDGGGVQKESTMKTLP